MKLEVKGLIKNFKNKNVLHGINFKIEKGDIVGLIGQNGAGKTTIIKSIFNEYRIQSGEILINDTTIKNSDYRTMEFFPDQNNFPKQLKIKDYCWYNYQLSVPQANYKTFLQVYYEILEALSLSEQKNNKFSQLSSGMQKRALLVSVLITKPKIIFLDEPTSNVDVQTKKEFISVLKELAQELGLIIVITTHQIEELERFVNRLIFVREGNIIYNNTFNSDKEDIYKVYDKAFQNTKPIINQKKIGAVFKNEKKD